MSTERFNALLEPGVLGFYHSCEVTLCGLLDHGGAAHNLFSVFSFESRALSGDGLPPTFLTKQNECFGDRLRLFVVQYQIAPGAAEKVYGQLAERTGRIETPLGPLQTGALSQVPPYFVPSDSTLTVPANRILKNNFSGGSMVLEWFGNQNGALRGIGEAALRKAALRIRELLPIDLFTLSDHIGNLLFQFPQQIACCSLSGSKGSVTCTVAFDRQVRSVDKYALQVYGQYDETLMAFQAAKGRGGRELTLTLPDTGGPYVVTLTDTERGIPILRQTTSMVRGVHADICLRGTADSIRTVRLPGGAAESVRVDSVMPVPVSLPPLPWERAVRRRQYQRRMDELERRLEFVRYGRNGDERAKALNDLRALMGSKPAGRVCLWDPYLSAGDLLETWYFTGIFDLELRAITTGTIARRAGQPLSGWVAEQRETLRQGSNQLGIDLRWRVQHGNFGFPFHDRFLIILSPGEEPAAWSLGTSVNSFGKTHHILQKVSNPGYIADDFESLWAALEDSSCQIWNSREDGRHG